ncbi:uncharacterized protein EKO05_0004442 [Ascochyta rabiei]|uniref:Uncharacterized protein n=1 Tax=Didymella rabiei TaxID=5454 RepID=A0A163DNQ5_DIDRA|nr:uncharacterized protein EKO05_0004442 [Ascochyta rabiei]KZM23278.1 hypothetical protein ST47_g5602 [Ascochyta rabiei]UPX13948.1 hypothetical protein EKO05_0004442 [Ascochyta rabiei]
MAGRRSARAAAKAPVKYTSDSDDSNFGTKKPRKSTMKAAQPTAKQGIKRSQSPDDEAEKAPKRRKKSPKTLAAEYAEKSKKQEKKAQKQQAKQRWDDWLKENDVSGRLLDSEPEREDCVTQTDSQKQYGLKANELVTLEHFEKANQYGGQTKLFLKDDVKKVAFRKYGLLAGWTDEGEIIDKGEGLWKKQYGPDAQDSPKEQAKEATPKPKTSKQNWAAYTKEHNVGDKKLSGEPEDGINQTDSKTHYLLTPSDLACLPHFPKPNSKYGNTTKLFNKEDVQKLAYRKAAVVASIEEGKDTEEFLSKGEDALDLAVAATTMSKMHEEA